MVDSTLIPAIKAALSCNELGTASPYCLSFAEMGQSGGSFGIFQGDANSDSAARDTLRQVLAASGVAAANISRIVNAVSQPCPKGNPLNAADTATANNALAAAAGMALVDAMDDKLMNIVLSELDSSIAAAAARSLTLVAAAQLYISLWVNMTGAPGMLNQWLSGTTELGVVPPAGPSVSRVNLENYLHASSFFRLHPRNFTHMSESVDAGLAVLPATT
jgi:hypothetical protein